MQFVKENVNESIETYLTSSYEKYKSYDRFHFIKEIIQKKVTSEYTFLDLGCAKGELIWFLKDFFPSLQYTGIDISDQLLSIARCEPKLNDVKFTQADLQSLNLQTQFDFVMMSGVLSIFDNYSNILDIMLKHLKAKGCGYIFGSFNENDVDVLIRFKNNISNSKKWESGYNTFSMKTIETYLKKFSEDIQFHKFNLSVNLVKQNNPITSYTLNTKEEGKIIMNGAYIMRKFYLVEFQKKQ